MSEVIDDIDAKIHNSLLRTWSSTSSHFGVNTEYIIFFLAQWFPFFFLSLVIYPEAGKSFLDSIIFCCCCNGILTAYCSASGVLFGNFDCGTE